MYIYLSKILPLLVLPVGIVIGFAVIAYILLRKGRTRASRFFLVTAILILWVASLPIVADALLRQLENDFPAVTLDSIAPRKCLVLLGGVLQPALSPRVDVNMLDGIDRVHKAAQLYKAGKAETIIVAGGNQPWTPLADPEARSIKLLLVDWGVPYNAIHVEYKSLNTFENALNVEDMLKKLECGAPLLVTSAAHMKRAVGVFENRYIQVFPVSADVRATRHPKLTVLDFLPSAVALNKTSDVVREWIGLMVYRYKGWI